MRAMFATVAAGVLVAGAAMAQQAPGQSQAGLQVAEMRPFGQVLTDSQGRALYLFTADKKGADKSACTDACAQAWPPFTAQEKPQLGGQVDESKIGFINRQDGSRQVTYNGWPLYFFSKDSGPGQATGQDKHGFGGDWYVVGPEGNAIRQQKAEAPGEKKEKERGERD